MKIMKYLFALALPTMLGACDSDLDKVTYHPGENVPAVLETIGQSYVLDVEKSDETVFTFSWEDPQCNYKAAITNSLQMDMKGKDFAGEGTQLIASFMNGSKSKAITHDELNKAMLNMLDAYGIELEVKPYDVEFRISSTIAPTMEAFASNVISTQITPYAGEREYPQLAVRGGYCGDDWAWANCQFVYSEESNHDYAGMIFFGTGNAQKGWKFCGDENWTSDNWGLAADDAGTDAETTLTLINDGGSKNITRFTKASYYLEFNNETGVLKVSKGHNFWGVIGISNKWGDTDDIEMTLADETANGKKVFYLTATVNVTAAGDDGKYTFKIRPDHAWTDEVNADNVELEGDVQKADGGNNMEFTEGTGEYVIKYYFNKVTPKVSVTKQ